ncbi:hypothetical protein BO83DRAFT_460243 [Aspergillus eucalypticola CBS 122712]|uniref:Uncharacterized protein n=1 Tax=Aspergillus eucalypticola (strain CBS 122712 / IBT 29274) TaxID=1448314 RepID=A0A317UJW7_ASPEC|nr:uncharacterized protein BO83DRAFT_460243 [Aspergillus eucalypticola CBS 122712]PWY61991.1 hypothetical protein BO83DRAFT_460243 [Aspergillus eucalypticola CBS 122712]
MMCWLPRNHGGTLLFISPTFRPSIFELAHQDHRKTRVYLSTLELNWDEHDEIIIIHNVYNPVPDLEPANSAITTLQRVLDRWKGPEQITVGD